MYYTYIMYYVSDTSHGGSVSLLIHMQFDGPSPHSHSLGQSSAS